MNWSATSREYELAKLIAGRAGALAQSKGLTLDTNFCRDIYMDVIAVHLNGTRLRLADLLNAPDEDFIHDVFGIRECLNRRTGRLDYNRDVGEFQPRYRDFGIIVN